MMHSLKDLKAIRDMTSIDQFKREKEERKREERAVNGDQEERQRDKNDENVSGEAKK